MVKVKNPGPKNPALGCPLKGASMVFPILRQSVGVMESMKSQAPSTKLPINLEFQYSMTKTQNRFGISNFGHCDLPFDLAQGGKLVEPVDTCDLEFLLFSTPKQLAIFAGKAIELCPPASGIVDLKEQIFDNLRYTMRYKPTASLV
jgi:hypothetical protein